MRAPQRLERGWGRRSGRLGTPSPQRMRSTGGARARGFGVGPSATGPWARTGSGSSDRSPFRTRRSRVGSSPRPSGATASPRWPPPGSLVRRSSACRQLDVGGRSARDRSPPTRGARGTCRPCLTRHPRNTRWHAGRARRLSGKAWDVTGGWLLRRLRHARPLERRGQPWAVSQRRRAPSSSLWTKAPPRRPRPTGSHHRGRQVWRRAAGRRADPPVALGGSRVRPGAARPGQGGRGRRAATEREARRRAGADPRPLPGAELDRAPRAGRENCSAGALDRGRSGG